MLRVEIEQRKQDREFFGFGKKEQAVRNKKYETRLAYTNWTDFWRGASNGNISWYGLYIKVPDDSYIKRLEDWLTKVSLNYKEGSELLKVPVEVTVKEDSELWNRLNDEAYGDIVEDRESTHDRIKAFIQEKVPVAKKSRLSKINNAFLYYHEKIDELIRKNFKEVN